MKVKDIYESTTAGSVASVSMPLGKPHKRGGNLLTGKKTNKKYANSVHESRMKQVAMDLETMQDGNFKQKYKKTKEQMRFALGDKQMGKTVHESKALEKVAHATKKGMKDGMRGVDNSHEYHPVMKKEELAAYRAAHRRALKKKNPLKPGFIDEGNTRLEEEDKIIAPGKGNKRRTGLHKPGEEKKLVHFKAPFKSSGIYVSDSRGNKVCDCENEDLAKEVAKAMNCYIKKDEGVIAGCGVGETKTKKGN